LRNLIVAGKQAEFKEEVKKKVDNATWLSLATTIVEQHQVKPGASQSEVERTELLREQWLESLLEAFSSPSASRNLADALIGLMGQHSVQKPTEDEEITPEHAHQAQILQFLIENNTGLLLEDRNSVGQTIVHIAAINGAYFALEACDWILRGGCGCNDGSAHKPSCSGLYSMIHAEDKEGHTPLYYAVLKGKTAVVGYLLVLLPNQEDPASLRKLLEIAIRNQSEAGEKIVHLLLLDRQSDTNECRKDIVREETLRHAVDYFRSEVFKLLLKLSTEDLSEKVDCNLLHYAVAKNQDEAAIMLLDRYPKLATTMHRPEGGSATPPGEGDGKLPLLAFYQHSDADSDLRRRILETLVEQLPISGLREHLTGPSCKHMPETSLSII
jgi:hypothetical protein